VHNRLSHHGLGFNGTFQRLLVRPWHHLLPFTNNRWGPQPCRPDVSREIPWKSNFHLYGVLNLGDVDYKNDFFKFFLRASSAVQNGHKNHPGRHLTFFQVLADPHAGLEQWQGGSVISARPSGQYTSKENSREL
jgi:hypothetical protein